MLFGCDSDSSYSVEDDAVVVPIAALRIAESTRSGGIGHVAGAAAKPDAKCGGEGGGEAGDSAWSGDSVGRVLFARAVSDDTAGVVRPRHPEGKAREIDRERADEHTPRYSEGRGAQPKKTIPGWTPVVPRPKYEGDPSALLRWLVEARNAGWSQGQGRRGQWEVPVIAKVHELLDAGIDVRYTVHGQTDMFMEDEEVRP